MRWTRSSTALTVAGFLWVVPALAHHAFSVAFDLQRFETQPPNTLRRTGVTATMLKPGITVSHACS